MHVPLKLFHPEEGEQTEHKGRKGKDEEPMIDAPEIGDDRRPVIRNLANLREHLLIGRAPKPSAHSKADQPGNQIIESAYAAAGDASSGSKTSYGHAYAEDDTAQQVADHIGVRHV